MMQRTRSVKARLAISTFLVVSRIWNMVLTVIMISFLYVQIIEWQFVPFLECRIETNLICAESNENGQVSAGPENNYKDVKGYDNVFDTLGKP